MPVFSVREDVCLKDGICASLCPAHVIKGPVGRLPEMRPGKENACIGCGHCMAFCPSGAARVDVLPQEDLRPIDRKLLPGAEAVEALCAARRSTRRFKPGPVPRDLLARVLAVARHAPSAKNRRPVRFIVVYERAALKAVGDAAAEWFRSMADNPDMAALAPEAKALARAWRGGLDPLFRGAPHLVLAVTPADWKWAAADAAIALTYIELAALPHGIGACWAGYVSTAAQQHGPLRQLLGVGDEEEVRGGQMLGFMGIRPRATAPRTGLPETWL